ncbi:carboxypeptidase-like regulatory domain-containing protein [Planctomicrobium sp. SH661]|uniref:carboxypeptidase-like regulatory domain-containing protein n=1 Tax=Planctomicrobium sp. SH661 TaxID=3448124 RepID=UPI003F5BA35A
MRIRLNAALMLIVSITVLQSGCSRQDKWEKRRPKVYKAAGVVRQGGSPLSDAIINFHPVEGEYGGTAVTGSDGKYQLTTFKEHDGVVPGEYKVTVEKNDWIPIGPKPSGPPPDGGVVQLQPLKKVPRTAPQYADMEKSGFTVLVTPDGPNQFSFDLEPFEPDSK